MESIDFLVGMSWEDFTQKTMLSEQSTIMTRFGDLVNNTAFFYDKKQGGNSKASSKTTLVAHTIEEIKPIKEKIEHLDCQQDGPW